MLGILPVATALAAIFGLDLSEPAGRAYLAAAVLIGAGVAWFSAGLLELISSLSARASAAQPAIALAPAAATTAAPVRSGPMAVEPPIGTIDAPAFVPTTRRPARDESSSRPVHRLPHAPDVIDAPSFRRAP